jgi:hypothetical protein
MRRLAFSAALVLPGTMAEADTGVSFEETFSAVAFGGDLAAYGDGGDMRLSLGIAIRQDERALDIVGGCLIDELRLEWGEGGYCFAGFDLRRIWQLNRLNPHKPRRAGLRLSAGAGPRYFTGHTSLSGYRGVGASGDVRLEGDVWVIGYYVLVGVDAMAMRIPVDNLFGIAPFFGAGAKLGWL